MEGESMYGPDSVSWKVASQNALLIGGGRALVLQVAHPLVGAGVAQHSDYEADPWGRLYRTLDTTTKIVFGDRATSEEAAGRLRRVHERVRGQAPGGRPYEADRPDLLLWVWATLMDTALLVYERFVGALSAGERERCYDEQTRVLVACGAPEGCWPDGYERFREYFAATVRSELQPTEDSRRIVESVLRPSVPLALRPLAHAYAQVTVGLLPPLVRERLGLSWGPRRELLLGASALTVRRAMPLLPSLLREFPEARAAKRRATSRDEPGIQPTHQAAS